MFTLIKAQGQGLGPRWRGRGQNRKTRAQLSPGLPHRHGPELYTDFRVNRLIITFLVCRYPDGLYVKLLIPLVYFFKFYFQRPRKFLVETAMKYYQVRKYLN